MWVTNPGSLARQEAQRAQGIASERVHRSRNTIDKREVPGRATVLKVATKCPTCDRATVYFADEDDNALMMWNDPSRTSCDVCLFEQSLEHDYAKLRPNGTTRDEADQELGHFASKWPMLANVLRPLVADFYARPDTAGRFAIGEITLPGKPSWPLSAKTLDEALARHASGDHGDLGQLDKYKLSDDQRWLPDLGDLLARNARAIERGSGIVRSRFEVPTDQLGRLTDQVRREILCDQSPANQVQIQVATLLHADAPPRTHVRLAHHNAACFGSNLPLSQ